PRRVAAGDHLLGAFGESVGAARAPAHRSLSGGHPGPGAVHPAAPHLARAACRQPRPDRGRRDPRHPRPRSDSLMKVQSSPTHERERTALVNLSEITEVELLILKRMKEFTIGEHRSLFHGTGFDFVGLREWAPGDRFSAIDWPQSSLTNFSPLIVREFEQPST